jgi:ADP-ribose pyrophosphatase YjhB (NUDIX family)
MGFLGWFDGNVPCGMEIKQVYGVLFSKDGRIMLLVDGDKISLPGGHPEYCDKNIEDTLRRETLEEVNISIENPQLLGYQSVDEEDGTQIFAQVRMTALINNVGVIIPDIDNGKVYKRLLVSPKKAIELLNWGEIGEKMIISALRTACKKFEIIKFNDESEYI